MDSEHQNYNGMQQTEAHASKDRRGGRMPVEHQCGAKTRSGTPCKGAAMPNGRCRMHGGSTPRGLDHPNTKSGRWSKYMKPLLGDAHDRRLERIEEVKRLDEALAFLDGRICSLLERIQTGERGTVWDDLVDLVGEMGSPDADVRGYMPDLQRLVTAGKETEEAYRDVVAAIHDHAKISAMEAKRASDAGEVASKTEVKRYMELTVQAIRDAVHEHAPEQASKVLGEFQKSLQVLITGQPRKIEAKIIE